MNFIEILLIITAFLSLYNFIFYPLILKLIAILRPDVISAISSFKPKLTFIIAAYNEETLIEGAIKSIKESDYPNEKITIIVGSDGSTDNTDKILEEMSHNDKSIIFIPLKRGGKNNVLNQIVPMVKDNILLFMDADIRLNKDTVSKLAAYFSNNDVGGVIASQKVLGDGETENAGSEGDSMYHKYEEFIRINEGIVSSNVNSLGYLYGIRKELFSPVPNNFVCDDLHNIYSVLQNKKRVLFAKEAKASEIRPKSLSNEFHRRVRAVSGGWATVQYHSSLLNFFKFGIISFFVWSHKILRWLSPVFLILLLIFTFIVPKNNYNLMVFVVPQVLLYGFATLGWIMEKLNIKISYFRIFLFFVSMNFSSLLGLIRFLSRQQNALWSREGFNK